MSRGEGMQRTETGCNEEEEHDFSGGELPRRDESREAVSWGRHQFAPTRCSASSRLGGNRQKAEFCNPDVKRGDDTVSSTSVRLSGV